MKYILHIDMNAFFASVEEVLNPSLKGKPVIVGGRTKRSVVSTCNYVARKYGIKAAMPIYMAQKKCPQAIIINGHYDMYEIYSNKFINVIKQKLTNKIEKMSIDECFVDITHLCTNKDDAYKLATKIQNEIFKIVGLQCSIGVSYNKFLAKMASDIKKPMGITCIFDMDDIKKNIWSQDIDNMFFIGKSSSKLLKEKGIKIIGDLAKKENIKILQDSLNKNWIVHYQHANGIGNDELDYSHNKHKSISASRTFLNDTCNYDEIQHQLKILVNEIMVTLIEEENQCKTISVYVKYPNFLTSQKSITLNTYTNKLEVILNSVLNIYDKNFINQTIRLIGVGVNNIVPFKHVESNLFDEHKPITINQSNTLQNIKKKVNDELGIELVELGSEKFKY